MYNLIDKIQETTLTANIPTVGYQNLLCLIATTGSNFEGTKAEADAIKAGLTVKIAENTEDAGEDISLQYVKVRTMAGTKHAFVEISLNGAYIKTLTFGENLSAIAKFLTFPTNSLV